MREIKFRLFYENEMFYSDNKHQEFDQPKREWIPILFWLGSSSYQPEEFSELTQFTGLQDVTGRDIYEGDIYNYGNDFLIQKGGYEYQGSLHVGFYFMEISTGQKLPLTGYKKFTYVGNIYENPELLEQGRGKNNN